MDSYLVKISDMISRKRADERFYNPKDIKTILQIPLAGVKYYRFSSLIAKNGIKTGKGIEKSEQGFGEINYLKVGNINEYFISYEEVETVSDDIVKKNKMPLLKTNDLLMSRVGTVGIVSIFRNEDPISAYSDNVMRIRLLESPQINFMYICIFLNSEYARAQIRRFSKQSLQEVINQTSIGNIVIPLPEIEMQNKISEAVLGHFKRIEEYQKLILEEEEKITSSVKRSLFADVKEDFRTMAHYEILRLLDKLYEDAQGQSSEEGKEKTLEDFVNNSITPS